MSQQKKLCLHRVDAVVYEQLFPATSHIFNSVPFNQLNAYKADAIHFLVFSDSKTRLGIILGQKGDVLESPFSAPFGGFSYNSVQRIETMEEATLLLHDYTQKLGRHCRITLPPLFYDPSQLAKWVNVLSRVGRLQHIDTNYHILLSQPAQYDTIIASTARNKLRQALKHPFKLLLLDTDISTDIERAYNVIAQNRAEHQYPLRMKLEDVIHTTKVLKADFFVLTLEGTDVAAAQIFHVADHILQVIYWGDLKRYAHFRTMNALAFMLYQFYSRKGYHILDIGPACENGMPNYGLCSFKEDIGCQASLKCTFLL